MKKILLLCLLLGLFAVEPHLGALRKQARIEMEAAPTPSEFALQFLGEIRYTLASYLWLKNEIYHHELGLYWSKGQVAPQDARKVAEILAICKLVTRLDPRFIQAYDLGAWRLGVSLGKPDEAISFLKEGLKNNPDSPLLFDDMGQLYAFVLKDCKNAVPYLSKASALETDKNELGIDLRLLGRCYETVNEIDKSIQSYRRLLEIIPDDAFARYRLKTVERSKNGDTHHF